MMKRRNSHSIAESLKEDVVVENASIRDFQEDLRSSEKERLRTSLRRHELVEELRSAFSSQEGEKDSREMFWSEIKRMMEEGTVVEINHAAKRVTNEIKILQSQKQLTQKSNAIYKEFINSCGLFMQKQALCDKINASISAINARILTDAGGQDKKLIVNGKLMQARERLYLESGKLHKNLIKFFENLESGLKSEISLEKNTEYLLYDCLKILDEPTKKKIISVVSRKKKSLTMDDRIALYDTIIEKLAKSYPPVASRIQSLARKHARELRAKNQHERAIAHLLNALQFYSEDSRTYQLLSDLYFELGLKDKGFLSLRRSLENSPENLTLRRRVAKLWYERGEKEKALDEYTIIINSDGVEIDDQREYGRLLFECGRYSEAISLLTDYCCKKPNDDVAAYWLAKSYLRTEMFNEALPLFQHVLAIDPENIEKIRDYAIVLQKIKMKSSAVTILLNSLEKNKKAVTLWLLLASIYRECEEWENVESTLRQAMELCSPNTSLYCALAESLLALNKFEEANELINSALSIDQTSETALLIRAKAKYLERDLQAAEKILLEPVFMN
ncbi:MAG: tetratricopeptide repeat protein [bacterium]|nr:tetratricopeptide repeat protein [bacterium]